MYIGCIDYYYLSGGGGADLNITCRACSMCAVFMCVHSFSLHLHLVEEGEGEGEGEGRERGREGEGEREGAE